MSSQEQGESKFRIAVVSGSFAVAVALITGGFNWLNRAPSRPQEPTPALSLPAPGHDPPANLRAGSSTTETPSLPQTAAALPTKKAPNPLLNFAAYQAVMKGDDERQKQSTRAVCLGRNVIWKGYVQSVTVMEPSSGYAINVSLCEDEDALAQALFQRPANCRFKSDPDGRVAALACGQMVTIIGRFEEANVVATSIVDCTLSEVHAP